MYKILGLVSILSASVITGFVMANELKDRLKLLKEIHQNAIYIKSELEYRAPDLEECFKGRGVLFSKAYAYIEKGCLPMDALIKACNDLKSLSKEDREIITLFAENLRAEEVNGQISNIEWFINSMNERISFAHEEYKTKGRLYKSSGALLGLGFMILFIN